MTGKVIGVGEIGANKRRLTEAMMILAALDPPRPALVEPELLDEPEPFVLHPVGGVPFVGDSLFRGRTGKKYKACLNCRVPHNHNNAWCSAKCAKEYRSCL